MTFWMALVTACGATWVNYILYRRRAISKRIASMRNHWTVTAEDLARLVFYIPFLPWGDRIIIKNNLDRISIVTIVNNRRLGEVAIKSMPTSKGRVEKSLKRWKVYRCGWVGITFCFAFGFSYIAMYLVKL